MKYKTVEWQAETGFPVKQGDLDFMCPIYAAINALHLVGDIDEVDQAAIHFRLAVMFIQAATEGDLARVVTEGVDPWDMEVLLRRLHWREITDLGNGDDCLDMSSLPERLAPTDGLKRAAVVSLVDMEDEDEVHHYIAADIGGKKTMRLYDSQSRTQISVEGETLRYGTERRPVAIRHAWVFTQRAPKRSAFKSVQT